MARPAPEILAHQEWLGFVQPTGLVVSAHAMAQAGVILDSNNRAPQDGLRQLVEERVVMPGGDPEPWIPDFRVFAQQVLGWGWLPAGFAGTAEAPLPDNLTVALPDYEDSLTPAYAVRDLTANAECPWQLLVSEVEPHFDLDAPTPGRGHFDGSAHVRMERLLRETGTPAGLVTNGRTLRLISAPRRESTGWLDFQVAEMLVTAGRPIASAMHLLLSEQTLLAVPPERRLKALLASSRKYQNEVSERLAEQVLHALYELTRGLQAAHDASHGELLRDALAHDPDEVYRGMLTVILRLVFLLYAEERGMLPRDEAFVRHYSLAGLHERLRADAALHPDTMDQRYGAWAQLLALFRMVFDGAESGTMHLPRRHGVLFDPDRFPFLEGRTQRHRQVGERIEPPLIPDGTIARALDQLLILDGERLSYLALDVEEIGSVYETMMGFRVEVATGTSLAIKAQKAHGAPTTVDLDALLQVGKSKRATWVGNKAARKLTPRVTRALKEASSIAELHQALDPVVDRRATPDLVPREALVLQPSEERRRSGSHYTPRALTEPIVRKTLEPVLRRLRDEAGGPPRPEQILDLKVCDPAMGSGAFLVETCRQLGDALVESWATHDERPDIPPDEDEAIHARRLVAQRCLYGVDRNPVAVDLAKVSLWLATLARDHAFTFLDHALRQGDSLVGLSLRQVEAFQWAPDAAGVQTGFETQGIREKLDQVRDLRRQIHEADEGQDEIVLRDLWERASQALESVRLIGDLAVAAFFEESSARGREARRIEYAGRVATGRAVEHADDLTGWRESDPPLAPFHWEIEFPEVFERRPAGFDAFVGNPPFAGKNTLASGNVKHYPTWLKRTHAESHGNADLVAHFFRRAFDLLREGGAFGLIATNTIAQGDTRSSGLRWICTHGGELYAATKRVKWPGRAAVVVSVVHGIRGHYQGSKILDRREVEQITAFLFHRGSHEDPARLTANAGKSFQGSIVLGMGFTFDDTDTKGVANPISEMERLIAKDPRNKEVIFPYIGGQEVNADPTHAHHRYVINFGQRSEEECRERWPDVMRIVEEKVKPERMRLEENADGRRRMKFWWQFGRYTPALFQALEGHDRVLFHGFTCQHLQFAFLPKGIIYAGPHNVFALSTNASFCALQSRPHEVWTRFFGSSLEDRLRYTTSDCFETFPFPPAWQNNFALEAAGSAYIAFRATLMQGRNEGLTTTYNRFHDPHENDADIRRLRDLHSAMDRAVLDCYGWEDIPVSCEFVLEHEFDEGESSRRKVPLRYRWPDDVRDEVLARLLELNASRRAEETRGGETGAGTGSPEARQSRRRGDRSGSLFT